MDQKINFDGRNIRLDAPESIRSPAAEKGRSPHGGRAILSRYALVLEIVAQVPGGAPLTEIGKRAGLPQATVYRLVHALVHVGFLAQGERRKHYVLGPRLMRLLCTGVPRRAINRVAQPILEQLAAEIGQTAFIAKLEDDEVQMVAVAPPRGEHQAFVTPGRSLPFHAAASAKAILAFADSRLLDRVLANPRRRYTVHTKTSEKDIAAELATIRRQGFATSDQELDLGVLSYACPIRLSGDNVIYSLGLVGLADHISSNSAAEVVGALRAAAETFSTALRDEASDFSFWNAPAYNDGAERRAGEL